MSDRSFDVVVFGATGFAGRLVAEYLAEHHPDVRWAMAGRNRSKLEAVRAEVAERVPAAAEVPLVVADSGDDASLRAMAASTRVVCTTVGPYQKYGLPLVAACVAEGAHYCDLTGEVPFMRASLDRYHEAAREAGVRIVHASGFDSIPSDVGTFVLQEALIARDGAPADEVKLVVHGARGGVSGGTVASLLTELELGADDRELRRISNDPYAINPEGERSGPDGRDRLTAEHDAVLDEWHAPFVMARINTRVVRRSNALTGWRYGRDFRYGEVMRMGRGLSGALKARAFAAGFVAFFGLLVAPPTRRVLKATVLPEPGQGPSRDTVDNGWFKIRLSGRRDGREVGHVLVTGQGDPGYGATACMLAESALSLALDDLSTPTGVLTPSVAMGQALVDRLDATKVQFAFGPA